MKKLYFINVILLIICLFDLIIFTKSSEEIPECIICYHHYPVVLKVPCGHGFCALCIEKIQHSKTGLDPAKCPICRKVLPTQISKYNASIFTVTKEFDHKKLQYIFPAICTFGSLELVQHWVETLGMNVNEPGFWNRFPIHLSNSIFITEYLLQKGANVDQLTGPETYKTALYIHARKGNFDFVKFLIQNGANVHHANYNGNSALHISAEEGHWRIVQYLVAHGAIIDSPNLDGNTPLLLSTKRGHFEIIKFLMQKGANINQRNQHGFSPLWVSAYEGNENLVKFFIEMGGNINTPDEDGITPLWIAAQNGFLNTIKVLIEHGANMNQAHIDGRTPLCVAAYHGYYEIVRFLSEHGADVNLSRNDGIGPLLVSIIRGHIKIAKWLMKNNADIEHTREYFQNMNSFDCIKILHILEKKMKDEEE